MLEPSAEPTPRITTFVLGDFQTNCFVVDVPGPRSRTPGTPQNMENKLPDQDNGGIRPCWIVDCGYDPEPLLDFVEKENLTPQAVLLTHGHCDHIAGLDRVISRFGPLPTYIHEAEAGFCSDSLLNLSALMGGEVCVTEPERYLTQGNTLELAGTRWRVVHAPGHSPGGVLFVHDTSGQAIVGDTLFAGSIGRMDFPTSDPESFRHTIFKVVLSLPDDMTIHPGHGPKSTIGHERATNPFVIEGF